MKILTDKIALLLLPFWDPQIPPLGISCLKGYLSKHGDYKVKVFDYSVKMEFRLISEDYFSLIKEFIPQEKIGNIYNIGNSVFRNHLMGYINKTEDSQYIELIKILFYHTFYTNLENIQMDRLNIIVEKYYSVLEKSIIDFLLEIKPTIIGFTLYGDTLASSIFAARLIKSQNPDILIYVGGGIFSDQLDPNSPDFNYFLERTKDCFDKIVVGEGEELFLRSLNGFFTGDKRVITKDDLNPYSLEISNLAIPDYSDLDLDYYPHLAHFGARSCPFQCNFCSETVYWGKYRKKNPSQTLKEFVSLYEKHGFQLFLLTDSTLNPIVDSLSEEIINSEYQFYWDGFLRADKHVCNQENTMLWRRGGFYRAKLGIESGSQNVLNLMNKKITIQQIKEALISLANAGIKTTTFWLFGFPGETDEDFELTLKLVDELKNYIYEADCNAYNYFYSGQSDSDDDNKKSKAKLLYPPWTQELLLTNTRTTDLSPSREIAYKRLNLFVQHCKKIGIPNPYSLNEIKQADERWCRLHENAVPPLISFSSDSYIDEAKYLGIKERSKEVLDDNDSWF